VQAMQIRDGLMQAVVYLFTCLRLSVICLCFKRWNFDSHFYVAAFKASFVNALIFVVAISIQT